MIFTGYNFDPREESEAARSEEAKRRAIIHKREDDLDVLAGIRARLEEMRNESERDLAAESRLKEEALVYESRVEKYGRQLEAIP